MHKSKSWIGLLPVFGLLTFLAGGYDNAAKAGPGACELAKDIPVCEPVKKISVKACEPVKKVPRVPVCEPVKKLATKPPKACDPVKSCDPAKSCESAKTPAPHGPVSLVLNLVDHVFSHHVAKTEYYPVSQPEAPPVKTTPAPLPPPPKAPTTTTVTS
jgi:hypothetical protein